MAEGDFFRMIRQEDGKPEVVLPGYVQRCSCLNQINWKVNQTQAGLSPKDFLGYLKREIEVQLELVGDTEEEIQASLTELYTIYHSRDTGGEPWVYEPRFPDLVSQKVIRIVFDRLEPVYVAGEPTDRQISIKFLENDSEPALTESQKQTVQTSGPMEAESGQQTDSGSLRDSKYKGKSLISTLGTAYNKANTDAAKTYKETITVDDEAPL